MRRVPLRVPSLLVLTAALALAVMDSQPAAAGFRCPADGCRGILALDRDTGEERWHINRDGYLYFRVGGANNDVVVATEFPCIEGPETESGSHVIAFDAKTGKRRWRTDGSVVDGEVTQGTVVAAVQGTIQGLDVRTGKSRWSVPAPGLPWRAASARLVYSQGIEALQDPTTPVVAYRRKTGIQAWTFQPPDNPPFGNVSPVQDADDATVVLTQLLALSRTTTYDALVHVLDAATGTERHTFTVTADNFGAELVDRNLVYSSEDGLVAYDVRRGEVAWRRHRVDEQILGSSAADGNVYVSEELPGLPAEVVLRAVDAKTGKPQWSNGSVNGGISLITAPGIVVFAGRTPRVPYPGKLTAFDPHTGEVRWRTTTPVGMTGNSAVRGVATEDGVFVNEMCDTG